MIVAFAPPATRSPSSAVPRPGQGMNIVLIDNFDTFTASLAEACRAAGAKVELVPNTVDRRRRAGPCAAP